MWRHWNSWSFLCSCQLYANCLHLGIEWIDSSTKLRRISGSNVKTSARNGLVGNQEPSVDLSYCNVSFMFFLCSFYVLSMFFLCSFYAFSAFGCIRMHVALDVEHWGPPRCRPLSAGRQLRNNEKSDEISSKLCNLMFLMFLMFFDVSWCFLMFLAGKVFHGVSFMICIDMHGRCSVPSETLTSFTAAGWTTTWPTFIAVVLTEWRSGVWTFWKVM